MLDAADRVARAATARRAFLRQSLTNGALLVVSAVVSRGDEPFAVTLASATVVVQIGLVAGLVLATSQLRECARDAIADDGDGLPIAAIADERRRLASEAHRARLARSLAAAHHASEHLDEIAIGRRPPPDVRNLAEHGETIAEIVKLVREPRTQCYMCHQGRTRIER